MFTQIQITKIKFIKFFSMFTLGSALIITSACGGASDGAAEVVEDKVADNASPDSKPEQAAETPKTPENTDGASSGTGTADSGSGGGGGGGGGGGSGDSTPSTGLTAAFAAFGGNSVQSLGAKSLSGSNSEDSNTALAKKKRKSDVLSARAEVDQDDLEALNARILLYKITDASHENELASIVTGDDGSVAITMANMDNDVLGAASTDDAVMLAAFEALKIVRVLALYSTTKSDDSAVRACNESFAFVGADDGKAASMNPISGDAIAPVVAAIEAALSNCDGLTGATTQEQATCKTEILSDTGVIAAIAEAKSAAESEALVVEAGESTDEVQDKYLDNEALVLTGEQQTAFDSFLAGTSNTYDAFCEATPVVASEDKVTHASSGTKGLGDNIKSQTNEKFVAQGESHCETLTGDDKTACESSVAQTETASLQDFLMGMGLIPVVAQATDAIVILVPIGIPFFEDANGVPVEYDAINPLLPGDRALNQLHLRAIKIGSGVIAAPAEGSGLPDYSSVPTLAEDVKAKLLGNDDSENNVAAVQAALDAAQALDFSSMTPAQKRLLRQARVFNEFERSLDHAPLISDEAQTLMKASESSLTLGKVASAVVENFKWQVENTSVNAQGLPFWSGKQADPPTGSTVSSSELLKGLLISLKGDAVGAAKQLTESAGFYGIFAGQIIEQQMQHTFEGFSEGDTLQGKVEELYPTTEAAYEAIIFEHDIFKFVQEDIAHGLTAALDPSLYGTVLKSDTSISAKAGFFFLNFLLKNQYLIYPEDGFFTSFTLGTGEGASTRIRPNYENTKFLVPSSETTTVTNIISSVLDVSSVNDDAAYTAAQQAIRGGSGLAPKMPTIRQFEEQNFSEIQEHLGTANDTVTLECTVERYDGEDPTDADGNPDTSNDALSVKLYAINYDDNGNPFKGDALENTPAVANIEGTNKYKYTFSSVPAIQGEGEEAQRGLEYMLRFDIKAYSKNDLPEWNVWVDGFNSTHVVCDEEYPFHIGPDEEWKPVPGIGLFSDQRFTDEKGVLQVESIDFSNLESGGHMFITAASETAGEGLRDVSYIAHPDTSGTYLLKEALSSAEKTALGDDAVDVLFAPLHVDWEAQELKLNVSGSTLCSESNESGCIESMYGVGGTLPLNAHAAIAQFKTDAALSTPAIVSNQISMTPATYDDWGRLYLMQDREGNHFIVEIRFADEFEEGDATRSFIDLGLAKINSLGEVELPEEAFGKHKIETGGRDFRHMFLHYGDWLVLENHTAPSAYTGPDLLPPEEVSFDDQSAHYTSLEAATDGLFFRYAGQDFEDNIAGEVTGSVDVFDVLHGVFGTSGFTKVEPRLDSGSTGLRFIKMTFNKQTSQWLFEANAPSESQTMLDVASEFAASLEHNDILAIFDSNASENPKSIKYIARVINDRPEDDIFRNEGLELAIVDYDLAEGATPTEVNVICFLADSADSADSTCSNNGFPSLYYQSDTDTAVGTVFDNDADGVPALFDPNDNDPNIPGSGPQGGRGGPGAPGGGGHHGGEGLELTTIIEPKEGGGAQRLIKVSTFGSFVGHIVKVELESEDIHGVTGLQEIFTCSDGSFNSATQVWTDHGCEASTVNGVTIAKENVRFEGAVFSMLVSEAVLDAIVTDKNGRALVDFKITFRQPVDPFTGESHGEAREPLFGSIPLNVPAAADVSSLIFTAASATVQEGANGTAAAIGTVSSIDVSKDLIFAYGLPIANAFEYKLHVYCAGSSPDDDSFFPEEDFTHFMPAKDAAGNIVKPNFTIGMQNTGGRVCDIELIAELEDEDGNYIGETRIKFSETSTTGGNSGGGFGFGNEIALEAGNVVCLNGTTEELFVSSESAPCATGMTLFTVDSINESTKEATLSYSSDVSNAFSGGGWSELAGGFVGPDAIISTNFDPNPSGAVSAVGLNCGRISTDDFGGRGHCETEDLNALLVRATVGEGDDQKDVLKLADGITKIAIEGDGVDANGHIPLNGPGFYRIVEKELVVLSSPAEGRSETGTAYVTLREGADDAQILGFEFAVASLEGTDDMTVAAIHACTLNEAGTAITALGDLLVDIIGAGDIGDWSTPSGGSTSHIGTKTLSSSHLTAIGQAKDSGLCVAIRSSDENPLLHGIIAVSDDSHDDKAGGIMNISVNVFSGFEFDKGGEGGGEGEASVNIHLETSGTENSYGDGDADTDTIVGRHYFMDVFLKDTSVSAVGLDVVSARTDSIKFMYFSLPPQFNLAGTHYIINENGFLSNLRNANKDRDEAGTYNVDIEIDNEGAATLDAVITVTDIPVGITLGDVAIYGYTSAGDAGGTLIKTLNSDALNWVVSESVSTTRTLTLADVALTNDEVLAMQTASNATYDDNGTESDNTDDTPKKGTYIAIFSNADEEEVGSNGHLFAAIPDTELDGGHSVEVAYNSEDSEWTFTFGRSVAAVERFSHESSGFEVIEPDSETGVISVVVDANEGFADMDVIFGDGSRYIFIAEQLFDESSAFAEWFQPFHTEGPAGSFIDYGGDPDSTGGFEQDHLSAAGSVDAAFEYKFTPEVTPNGKLMTSIGSKFIFSALDSVNGQTIWATDGTNAGTIQILDAISGAKVNGAEPSPYGLTKLGSNGYFFAIAANEEIESQDHYKIGLYVTDGTANGTSLLRTFENNNFAADSADAGVQQPYGMIAVGSVLYYVNWTQISGGDDDFAIERFDPAESGEDRFSEVKAAASDFNLPHGLKALGSKAYFIAADSVATSPALSDYDIWEITEASTPTVLKVASNSAFGGLATHETSLLPAIAAGRGDLKIFHEASSKLYALSGVSSLASNLMSINSSGAVTSIKAFTVTAADTEVSLNKAFKALSSSILFTSPATEALGSELWKTDGTSDGTVIVKDINPPIAEDATVYSSTPRKFVELDSKLYFVAHTETGGLELWATDGTANGTTNVSDIQTGTSHGINSNYPRLTEHNEKIYLAANDGTNGLELWVSEGGASDTELGRDFNVGAGSSNPVVFKHASSNASLFTMVQEGNGQYVIYRLFAAAEGADDHGPGGGDDAQLQLGTQGASPSGSAFVEVFSDGESTPTYTLGVSANVEGLDSGVTITRLAIMAISEGESTPQSGDLALFVISDADSDWTTDSQGKDIEVDIAVDARSSVSTTFSSVYDSILTAAGADGVYLALFTSDQDHTDSVGQFQATITADLLGQVFLELESSLTPAATTASRTETATVEFNFTQDEDENLILEMDLELDLNVTSDFIKGIEIIEFADGNNTLSSATPIKVIYDGADAASKDDPWEYDTADEVFRYRAASDIIISSSEITAIQTAAGSSGNGVYLIIYTSSFDDDGFGLLYIELPADLFTPPEGE